MTVTGSREALKPVTPLENVLRVMKSARRNDELMAVWSDDVKAVEDAIAALSPDPAGVTLTVEMIAREVRRAMLDNPTDESFNKRAAAREKIADECARTILALIQSKMGKP